MSRKTSTALENSLALLNELKGQINQNKSKKMTPSNASQQQSQNEQGKSSNAKNSRQKSEQYFSNQPSDTLNKIQKSQRQNSAGITHQKQVEIDFQKVSNRNLSPQYSPQKDPVYDKIFQDNTIEKTQKLNSSDMAQKLRNSIKNEIQKFSAGCDSISDKIQKMLKNIDQNEEFELSDDDSEDVRNQQDKSRQRQQSKQKQQNYQNRVDFSPQNDRNNQNLDEDCEDEQLDESYQ